MSNPQIIYLDTLSNLYLVHPAGMGRGLFAATLDDALALADMDAPLVLVPSDSMGEYGITGVRRVLGLRDWTLVSIPDEEMPVSEEMADENWPIFRGTDGPLYIQSKPSPEGRSSHCTAFGRCPEIPPDRWLEAGLREGLTFTRVLCQDGERRWVLQGHEHEVGK